MSTEEHLEGWSGDVSREQGMLPRVRDYLDLCSRCLICCTLIQALAKSMQVMRIKVDKDLREDRFDRA